MFWRSVGSLRHSPSVMSVEKWAQISSTDPDRAWARISTFFDPPQISVSYPPQQPPNTVRIVCISDTHALQYKLGVLPAGDILIHAGDLTNTGNLGELKLFDQWMGQQTHPHKIAIAGNHDITLQKDFYELNWKRFHYRRKDNADECRAVMVNSKNFCYLEDSSVQVMGLNIYGSPWQPMFCDWAYNLDRGEPCAKTWAQIPSETDILVTHGPPIGIGDLCTHGGRAGCVDLLREIETRLMPRLKLHVFGHIHEGYGIWQAGSTLFANASTCTESYRPTNPPLVIDVPMGTP